MTAARHLHVRRVPPPERGAGAAGRGRGAPAPPRVPSGRQRVRSGAGPERRGADSAIGTSAGQGRGGTQGRGEEAGFGPLMGLRPPGAGHGSAPPPRGAAAPARPTQPRWRGRGVPCRESPVPAGSLGSPILPSGRALRSHPWVPWGSVPPVPQRGPLPSPALPPPPTPIPSRPAGPQLQCCPPQGASAFDTGFFFVFPPKVRN